MPGATPVYAIRYPYMGDPITPADFANEAADIDRVLTLLTALEQRRLQRPYVSVAAAPSGNIVINVETIISFNFETTDTDNMFTLGAPDRFTVVTPGVYLVGAVQMTLTGWTTLTFQRASILVNGSLMYAEGSRALGNSAQTSVDGFVTCAAGDIIQLRVQWGGTVGPAQVAFVRFFAMLVCDA